MWGLAQRNQTDGEQSWVWNTSCLSSPPDSRQESPVGPHTGPERWRGWEVGGGKPRPLQTSLRRLGYIPPRPKRAGLALLHFRLLTRKEIC